jgi:hypothetical protein
VALAFGPLYALPAGAHRRGFMRLSTRFAPERIVDHGRRCDEC